MANFLDSEGIYDAQRLPTNAVLAVIASLYASIPDTGDKRGQDELLLKRYLWHSFFTDRYENSAASHAFSDFNVLKKVITGQQKEDSTAYSAVDVPIFTDHSLVDIEEILADEWPKRASIRGRGVLVVLCRLGAQDFSTGQVLSAQNITNRHYHHVYPDALLKEAGIHSFLALNCALIEDKTNLNIGRKEPLAYLKERYQWVAGDIVQQRLQSHLIPVKELANGGYEDLSEDDKTVKLKKDFEAFLLKRANLVMVAVEKLAAGNHLTASDVINAGTL